ncbi:hypothetical protein QBC43DRAFT_316980 [Cladorrhinum sp. PSN259]|nr:hypothetical protein QBC43DRAFT_316980 [Cladorrhinum sp. PSN259]
MDSVPLPPGPVPITGSPPAAVAETTTIQSFIVLFYTIQSIIWTITIGPFLWGIRTSYSLTSYILSPFLSIFLYLFLWVTWPFAILIDIYNVFEPLAIFFSNALIIGLIAGAAIAIAAASLTFFLGFIIPQDPPNYIPESDLLRQQAIKIKKERSSSSPRIRHTHSGGSSDDLSSFDSDDDPWTSSYLQRQQGIAGKGGAGGAGRGGVRPSTTKLLLAPGKKKQQKVIVGLLNETIHEEESTNSDGEGGGGSEGAAFEL